VVGQTTTKSSKIRMPDPLATFRLDGKVAIVTGASSGLGARFARVLAAAGARVVVAARRLERLEALAVELPDGALPVQGDLARTDDIDRLVATTLDAHGRIDVLVNNAGTVNALPALDEAEDDFERVLRVNVTACFALAKRAARDMMTREEGGSIVNVASIAGLVGIGRIPLAAYVASKGGVVAMTRELAAQWAQVGVRVNAIAPGWFPSEMTAGVLADEELHGWIRSKALLGRAGNEHELDGAMLFLASPASSYVTGQVLAVDGGWSST
jgi:NAD(P)-dependent dehydrogenase (short-subunit alcohol dehydrogenase family)